MLIVPREMVRSLACIATLLLAFSADTQLLSQTNTAERPMPTAATPQPQSEAPKIPAFEVISVRRNLKAQGLRDVPTADGYSASGVTVLWLLTEAYGIRQGYRIFGAPDWSGTYRYDIQAKVDDSDVAALQKLDVKLRYQMIRQILADRFKLKVHFEERTQPIYSLIVVDKDHLPPPADPKTKYPNGLFSRSRAGQLTATSLTMDDFANFMSSGLGRMIVDNTGLTGRYDIKLDWSSGDINTSDSASYAPSVFTAVKEQLGLKLVPTTGPVKCLIIDHVEPPSEN